jgi:CRP-like cAMP-binding protein
MHPGQMKFVGGLRPAPVMQSTTSRAPDRMEAAQFLEAISGQGDCLHLSPQQRVPIPPAEKVVVLREGMLAIDAMPAKGKLQVLDFLVPGDVVSASTVLPMPGVSLRAITSASLVSLDPPAVDRPMPSHDYWTFLISQCMHQLARVNIHQLMIGRLETESRVASFVLSLALGRAREEMAEITISLPMSRTDIANYLVINCDTLSRTMMKFCDCGLIKRVSRHAIRIIDLDGLEKKSPLASLLSRVFGTGSCQQASSFGCYAEKSASMARVHESFGVIQPVVTIGPLSRAVQRTDMPHVPRGAYGR